MDKIDRKIGHAALLAHGMCMCWMIFSVVDMMGWIVVLAEACLFILLFLYLRNHSRQLHYNTAPVPASGTLDVFLPVVNEPVELFERTLCAACAVQYPKTIYVLDDGCRASIRRLAMRYRVQYLCRGTNRHFKAGNLNHGLDKSQGDFILVLDADQIVEPEIAQDLLGYFARDKRVAIVATRQRFDVPECDFNQEYVFYGQMQPGKNADNAAISCGSGVFYRRTALQRIGGFATWNLVEDVTTSFLLHEKGFVSVYIDKSYTTGTAPGAPKTIFKQRTVWALDTLRLFWYSNPLSKGLTFAQKCHYFEMGWAYLCAGLFLPVLFVLLPVSYFFDFDYFNPTLTFLLLKGLAVFLTFFFLHRQCRGKWQAFRYWVALFPAYFVAFCRSLQSRRPEYVVTEKRRIKQNGFRYILPHLIVLGLCMGSVLWYTVVVGYGLDEKALVGIFWILLMVFWFWPLLKRAILTNRTEKVR